MTAFDWHKLSDSDLRYWIVPNLLSYSQSWKNGEELAKELEAQFDKMINERAKKLIQEKFGEVYSLLYDLEQQTVRSLINEEF